MLCSGKRKQCREKRIPVAGESRGWQRRLAVFIGPQVAGWECKI